MFCGQFVRNAIAKNEKESAKLLLDFLLRLPYDVCICPPKLLNNHFKDQDSYPCFLSHLVEEREGGREATERYSSFRIIFRTLPPPTSPQKESFPPPFSRSHFHIDRKIHLFSHFSFKIATFFVGEVSAGRRECRIQKSYQKIFFLEYIGSRY